MPYVGDVIEKDPAASLLYEIDWTSWLAPSGTIQMSSWSVTNMTGGANNLTAGGETILAGNKITQVRLSGGTTGQSYRVTNHIQTASGDIDERSFFVSVTER